MQINKHTRQIAWSHTEVLNCGECHEEGDRDSGFNHIFVVFHTIPYYIYQCTTCGTQYRKNKDGSDHSILQEKRKLYHP